MVSKKIIFLGSKPIGYECLAYLIAQKESLNLTIEGVLTGRRQEFGDTHDLEMLAAHHGIPVLSSLDELPECDIIYSVQYHVILRKEHIAKARLLAVNLHMAPLPEYRGSNQFSFAILDQRKEFGATIHAMDTGIDNGDILFQQRFPIPYNCWVNDLYQLTYNASIKLFRESLPDIVNGKYTPVKQESLVQAFGTSIHYRREMDEIKIIDLAWDLEKIERHIRATSMPGFEPPYCIVAGRKVYIVPA